MGETILLVVVVIFGMITVGRIVSMMLGGR
jgi:hypothetical protein